MLRAVLGGSIADPVHWVTPQSSAARRARRLASSLSVTVSTRSTSTPAHGASTTWAARPRRSRTRSDHIHPIATDSRKRGLPFRGCLFGPWLREAAWLGDRIV